jgi:hypothetical protein
MNLYKKNMGFKNGQTWAIMGKHGQTWAKNKKGM